ncbi:exported hypothetical protein [Paraburkholderia piptadeniae]|uniref:Uncharacterized protein n=1 Tax=Paraburkholderia piptadeniae TaxID=1701573 RepID=A0A1N7RYG0_9BURK|nr:exported hypothetical protein [Paraburkholderia piptadeniae]
MRPEMKLSHALSSILTLGCLMLLHALHRRLLVAATYGQLAERALCSLHIRSWTGSCRRY